MSAFTGVKVISATMVDQRRTLGEQVTQWLDNASRERPGFEVVDIVIRQSSDDAFHCLSATIFFIEDLEIPKKKGAPRR